MCKQSMPAGHPRTLSARLAAKREETPRLMVVPTSVGRVAARGGGCTAGLCEAGPACQRAPVVPRRAAAGPP